MRVMLQFHNNLLFDGDKNFFEEVKRSPSGKIRMRLYIHIGNRN